jgi:hypothetical protein
VELAVVGMEQTVIMQPYLAQQILVLVAEVVDTLALKEATAGLAAAALPLLNI